jgi:hypothetical protein
MRPGRMKHKARARHRRVAVTCAGVSALTVMGGTTAFAADGHWNGNDDAATLDNGGDAWTHLDQDQHVLTAQLGLANSGKNEAVSLTGNLNLGEQDCETNLRGGNILFADDDNTAGNSGGDCTNNSTATNNGTGNATVSTGDASAPNTANTTVSQGNSGGSSVNNSANDNTIEADDGPASLSNGGNAKLAVNQHSSVKNLQAALANTGGNTAVGVVVGVNAGSQTGTSHVSGGNILFGHDGNTAGNTGGNAGNTSSASNTGSGTASVTTGNATASNSSTTSVTQTNSGGSSATNTANGNTITSD